MQAPIGAPPSAPFLANTGRTRERAGLAVREVLAAAAAPDHRDRVRARNDRAARDLPHVSFKEASMTAYLISLALAGLLAIAICDGCT